MIAGCDPGKNGGVVVMTDTGKIISMYTLPHDDIGQLSFRACCELFDGIKREAHTLTVFLERAMPMAMGAKHAFNYGMDFRSLELSIVGNKISYVMVEPSKWMKVLHQGTDSRLKPKERSLLAAERLFPEDFVKMPRSPKAGNVHLGIVEAALLAEYGRRSLQSSVN